MDTPLRYTCKFLGCGKVYASSDAVRKHARNHHPEWLKQCELEQCEKRRGEKVEAYCIISQLDGDAPEVAPLPQQQHHQAMAKQPTPQMQMAHAHWQMQMAQHQQNQH